MLDVLMIPKWVLDSSLGLTFIPAIGTAVACLEELINCSALITNHNSSTCHMRLIGCSFKFLSNLCREGKDATLA